MTKNKRFTFSGTDEEPLINDNITGKEYPTEENSLIELLNDLNDETIELHIQNDFLKDENQHIRTVLSENEQLKKEILRLNHELKGYVNDEDWAVIVQYNALLKRNDKLKKEIEQLKETINELRDMDKEKDIEIEHINNIYKEFGFKGIIDYAKDKLQNYGTVREVGNGLWLLATGGWSDNEFWLDCLLNWNFMYAKGHYCAMTSGGGYYYTETPYEDIEIKKRQIKG